MGRAKQLKPRDLLIRSGPYIFKKHHIENHPFKLFNTIFFFRFFVLQVKMLSTFLLYQKPTSTDSRSLATKIFQYLFYYFSSEFGYTNPLSLNHPTTNSFSDRIPTAPEGAAAQAADFGSWSSSI